MTAPGLHDISIGDKSYLIDWASNRFVARSYPAQRQQIDTSARPGEGALNPADLWRRVITSWHHGAGQSFYDADSEANPFRFRESSMVDVWTRNELRLLNAASEVWKAQNIHKAVVVGSRLVVLQSGWTGSAISYATVTPSGPSDFTPYTDSGQGWVDITTDGEYLYATDGQDVYRWAASDASVGSAWNTLDCDRLGYVRGRLMAGDGNDLYNITSSSVPSALYTAPLPGFFWYWFAETPSHIYAAGRSGNASGIFKIDIKDDGSALDTPVSAGSLPAGENLLSIGGYAGFILVGTEAGVRVAAPDADGFLTMGPLLPIGPTYSFEGYGNFVWCGTEGNPAKLWRLDMSTFTEPLAPAYASDMECSSEAGDSRIESIVTFNGKRVFTRYDPSEEDPVVDALYVEGDDPATEGWLKTGRVRFGIPDQKEFRWFDFRTEPLAGSLTVKVNDDPLMEWQVNASGDDDDTVFQVVDMEAVSLVDAEFKVTLTPDSGESPVVTTMMVRAHPQPERHQEWQVPVLIRREYSLPGGQVEPRDPKDDYEYIVERVVRRIEDVPAATTVTFGTTTYLASILDFEFYPQNMTNAYDWNGTLVVTLKILGESS